MSIFNRFSQDLLTQSQIWVEKGIVSAEQSQKILSLYNVTPEQADKGSFGSRIVSSLGYLFIGLALLLLVGSNWEELPRAVRAGGLVGVMGLLTLGGIQEWTKGNLHKASNFLLLGGIAFGGTIFLIAQTYHLSGSPTAVFIYWGLGVLPSVLATKDHKLLKLFSLISIFYLGICTSLFYIPWAYYPATLLIYYLLFTQINSKTTFFVQTIGLFMLIPASMANFWEDIPNTLRDNYMLVFCFSLGMLLIAAAPWLKQCSTRVFNKSCADSLSDWLLTATLIGLFIASFQAFWREFSWPYESMQTAAGLGMLDGVAVLTIIVAGLLVLLKVPGGDNQDPRFLEKIAAIFYVLFILKLLHPDRLEGYHLTCAVVVNLLIFAWGLCLIFTGSDRRMRGRLLSGAAILCLLGFVRYISLIGDYVGASVLFIIEGIILIAVARYSDRLIARRTAGGQ